MDSIMGVANRLIGEMNDRIYSMPRDMSTKSPSPLEVKMKKKVRAKNKMAKKSRRINRKRG